ncbi:MT-A70 family methyltransferase [Pedobacter sp.]|uniref:MT-A70 family methyltransferase n=1 Tax=Pedobacter sp. TaxID=1411316 RepID=UPI00396CB5D2
MGKGYDVLMVDPPWNQCNSGKRKVRPNQLANFSYKTMSTEQIFTLLDKEILISTEVIHNVFVWAIEKFLNDCEFQMRARGYKMHCRFIWNKLNGIAPAYTIRFCHEYLLWFYKPVLLPIAKDQRGRHGTVFTERKREHSRKPDIAYEIIENLYPDATRIDVFSREKRKGWDQYGDQKNFFQKEQRNNNQIEKL